MDPRRKDSHLAAICSSTPLFVDLDGTLIRSDTLVELLLRLVKKNPLVVFLLPLWLSRGKARFKREVACRVDLDPLSVPYEPTVLSYLREQHQLGRQVVLVTAADERIAGKIAEQVGCFTAILASEESKNLCGDRKLKAIREFVGSQDFIYFGNANIDLPIWQAAKQAVLVNCTRRLLTKASKCAEISCIISTQKSRVKSFVTAIRAYQWVKNGLLFVPLLTGHHLTEGNRLLATVAAFLAFSLCSSSTYVLNDLLDLEADRRHPSKKRRPFASGDLALKVGLLIVPILLCAGLALSLLLPSNFTIILAVYCLLTITYSFYLKRFVMVDVILLALLYTLRIIAGGVASRIIISNWLLAFSMFFFLSLALLKRYSELHEVVRKHKDSDVSRGYSTADMEQLASMGSASGYLTALVLGLYINSEDVKALYAHPEFLWLICPLILYWISRVWLVARRGYMNDDPIIFAIKDKTSYAVGLATVIIVLFAMGWA